MPARSPVSWWVAKLRGALGRSALVGLAATAVDLGLLALLVEHLGASPAVANVPALLAGLAVQFFGNKYFAFGDRSRDFVRQGARFALVEAVTFALNATSFHVLAVWLGLPYLVARPLGELGVYLGYSFPRWQRIFTPVSAPNRRV